MTKDEMAEAVAEGIQKAKRDALKRRARAMFAYHTRPVDPAVEIVPWVIAIALLGLFAWLYP